MQKIEDNLDELKAFIEKVKQRPYPQSYLIAVLHKAQKIHGYLDRAIMDKISYEMNVPAAHIWGVATFYHFFNLTPKGEHTIYICLGTACYVKGANEILDTIKKELKINVGETTIDGLFTLQSTRCVGACGLAPVMMIDEKIYGELTCEKVINILDKYRKRRDK